MFDAAESQLAQSTPGREESKRTGQWCEPRCTKHDIRGGKPTTFQSQSDPKSIILIIKPETLSFFLSYRRRNHRCSTLESSFPQGRGIRRLPFFVQKNTPARFIELRQQVAWTPLIGPKIRRNQTSSRAHEKRKSHSIALPTSHPPAATLFKDASQPREPCHQRQNQSLRRITRSRVLTPVQSRPFPRRLSSTCR